MIRAWLEGLRAGASRPGLVLLIWFANLAVALPAGWVLAESLRESIGSSLVHEKLRDGFDMGWYGEFRADAQGLEGTFTPAHTGIGAILPNLEGWATGRLFDQPRPVLGLAVAFLLVWTLICGGVIERLARISNAPRAGGIFQHGGRFFLRFLRLGLLSVPLYWLVYRLHRWLFNRLSDLLRDVTTESTALLYTGVVVLFTATLLVLVHVCFDYARIVTVIEDRRSMLLAALRGIGFVLSHPRATLGLYLMMAVVSLTALLIYAFVAPGIAQTGAVSVLFAFAVSQLFLMVKTAIRVSLLAAELQLYRART